MLPPRLLLLLLQIAVLPSIPRHQIRALPPRGLGAAASGCGAGLGVLDEGEEDGEEGEGAEEGDE